LRETRARAIHIYSCFFSAIFNYSFLDKNKAKKYYFEAHQWLFDQEYAKINTFYTCVFTLFLSYI